MSAAAPPGELKIGVDVGGTFTDLVLVDGGTGAGGSVWLDADAARAALDALSSDLGGGTEEVAQGVYDIANANMMAAIRGVTIYKGIDPREYTLVCYGSAGAQHVSAIAGELGIGEVAAAAPERAFAENLSSTGIICWGGEDDRSGTPQPFVNMQLSFGSWGGTATSDGLPYCLSVVGNCSEIAVEILELEYPFVCLDKEFMIDTAGPGRFRGGPGITYTNRSLVDAEISLSCDRMRYGPWGLLGGAAALPQTLYEVRGDDVPFELGWSPVERLRPISGRFDREGRADADGEDYRTSKFSHVRVPAGTTLRIVNAGGGGYGDPLERDPERLLDDVRSELVSPEAAREHYGVVLRDGLLVVDEAATGELRASLGGTERRIKLGGWRDGSWFDGRSAP